MDILSLYAEALTQFWFIIPLFLFIQLFKSRWFKGVFGEFRVNRLLSKLPAEHYTIIKDVTLPTTDDSTQIDHIIISTYGIFVVETKNIKGWIFGSATQAQWTQKIYRHTFRFQNPLHQNYKHIKTLEAALGCPAELLHSVIVFIGDSEFKTNMPDNVTDARQCLDYIRRFQQPVLNTLETQSLAQIIAAIKLKPGIATDLAHHKHVKDLLKVSE